MATTKTSEQAQHVDGPVEGEEPEEVHEFEAALQDLERMECGDPFPGDVEASEELRHFMSEDIGEEAFDKQRAATIKANVIEPRSQTQNPKLKKTRNAKYKPTETALEAAADYVRNLHGDSVLTESELEEEALLLLVRNFEIETDTTVKNILDDDDRRSKKNYLLDVVGDMAALGSDSSDSDSDSDGDGLEFEIPTSDKLITVSTGATMAGGGDDAEDQRFGSGSVASGSGAIAGSSGSSTVVPKQQVSMKEQKLQKLLAKLRERYQTYEASILDFLSSVADIKKRNQKPVGENGEISFLHRFVDGQHELFAVSWANADLRQGRPTRIDSKQRVVYTPTAVFGQTIPVEDYSACDVLVTAAGASNRRYAGNLRDELPGSVVRFLLSCKMIVRLLNKAGSDSLREGGFQNGITNFTNGCC